MGRHRLAHERVRHGPFAADADAGDGARDEERPESGRESREQRADAVDQNRDHQQRLAAEAVRERAAEHAADRRERERRAEQHGNVVLGEREVRGERRRGDQEAQEQQVVEVEDPADE